MAGMAIGFIGAGQMARALAQGFVAAELVSADRVFAFDPVGVAADQFGELVPGSQILASNAAVVDAADVVILAVKPQCIGDVMHDLAEAPNRKVLFVSIIAGISLASLCKGLRSDRIVRVMPNTPCLVGVGAAGYSLGTGATAEDGELVGRLMNAIGIAVNVPESLLDAVTGLSGSGPAYVYTMIEALSDGGVRAGLPRATATALAAQTVFGAAQMVISTGEHPGVLKDRVTSPGGTTIAGLQVLERAGFRSALIDAVAAASQRSQELGQS
ncbi:MAG: pyrroline-5-carboxylate reductase [Planctomycetaceae bacterium]|nr:pyrroline-5-carboxylate reductase [Planctomycetales bacterium]MCB9927216.1 pyrroline-5-carboxylate reductase [Planctomycetaceae bacterium]